MNIVIKNLHLLNDILSATDIGKIEYKASALKQAYNLSFKVVEISDLKVKFQVVQGKTLTDEYFTVKQLVTLVKETFGVFFKGRTMLANPIPYRLVEPATVNSFWVQTQMRDSRTRLKDIAQESGIEYQELSDALNGGMMSKTIKAFFWYYFKSKGN